MASSIKSNPIKNDPVLKDLLNEAKNFSTPDDFKGWRKSFLDAYENYLDEIGRENAHSAETHLLTNVKQLSKTVIKVHAFTQDGSITNERASVKGQRALTDMTDQMASTEKLLHQFMPTTQEVEEKMGYNKFELGAVLIADGFEVYEILKGVKDITTLMMKTSLEQATSSNSKGVMTFFIRQVDTFADVMADLGLLNLMEKVVEVYQKYPRNSPQRKKAAPAAKEEEAAVAEKEESPPPVKPKSVRKVVEKDEKETMPKPKPKKVKEVAPEPAAPAPAPAQQKRVSKTPAPAPAKTEPKKKPKAPKEKVDPMASTLNKAKQKTRAIYDGGYVNPLMAGSSSGGTGKRKSAAAKDTPTKPASSKALNSKPAKPASSKALNSKPAKPASTKKLKSEPDEPQESAKSVPAAAKPKAKKQPEEEKPQESAKSTPPPAAAKPKVKKQQKQQQPPPEEPQEEAKSTPPPAAEKPKPKPKKKQEQQAEEPQEEAKSTPPPAAEKPKPKPKKKQQQQPEEPQEEAKSTPPPAAAKPKPKPKKKQQQPEEPQDEAKSTPPPPKTKNPQDDNASNDDGDDTDFIVYFDMKTGTIGKILRRNFAQKEIVVLKDEPKLEGEIEDEREREDLLWAMKKAMKKKNKK